MVLQEAIEQGQHISSFRLEAFDGKEWTAVCRGTTIGYKMICWFPAIRATKLQLIVESARSFVALTAMRTYYDARYLNV